MPDKVVQVPGLGNVSFPGTMSDDDISSAIQKQGPNAGLAPPAAPGLNDMYQVNPLTGSRDLLSEGDKVTQQKNVEAGMRDYYQTNPAGMYGMGIASNAAQGVQDFSQGNVKKGIHSTAKAAGIASLPFLVPALANAPLAAIGGLAGGTALSKGASAGAGALGASQDTQDVAGDAGGLVGGLAGGLGGAKLSASLPSKSAAGALFNEASAAAGKTPIDVSDAGNTALQIRQMAQSGGSQPKVVRDFIARATDPNQGPITYDEARMFYSNASRLSADEAQRLTPNMKRMVGQFARNLGDSIASTAGQQGVGTQYQSAMAQYRNAMMMQSFMDMLKNGAVSAATKAAGGGLAGYGAAKIIDKMTK